MQGRGVDLDYFEPLWGDEEIRRGRNAEELEIARVKAIEEVKGFLNFMEGNPYAIGTSRGA